MRAGIVALVGMLAACEVSPGVYFEVSGSDADIAFDELEFFIAKGVGDVTPFTPARPFINASEPPMNERQRLFERLFAVADIQQTEVTQDLTLYLPPDDQNLLPDYLLVVAWRHGEVVGLAEVEEFHVMDDGAYIYQVPLGPVDSGFERWGAPLDASTRVKGEDCVRWTRQRAGEDVPSTYAVVRDSSHDCDPSPSLADCDDLNFCASAEGTGCRSRAMPCMNETSCDIGTCTDGTAATMGMMGCSTEICLPEYMCAMKTPTTTDCLDTTTVAEFLACAIDLPRIHTEVTMPTVAMGGRLCGGTFEVVPPSQLPCNVPVIVWPPLGMVGNGHRFSVDGIVGDPRCRFTLTETTALMIPPLDSHLIVSVLNPGDPRYRTSFVIGFQPQKEPPFDCGASANLVVTYPMPMQEKPVCP